ncbi:MAG: hypothetical protein LUG16_04400 [Candidatus Gastranaerophilales bacterium]|nr:hypothetical protein [Candidatus Gastranaerophilales bacterium]
MKITGALQQNKYSYNEKNKKHSNSFNGTVADAAFNVLDKGFKVLDKNAMIQVSFIDTVSTNIPRTLVDLKTGLAAAMETFRREFSGLFVNCLMPGLIVKGIAMLLPKSEQLKGTNPSASWANADAVDKMKNIYNQVQNSGAEDKTKEYVKTALGSIEGLDGKNWVKYADKSAAPQYQEAVDIITGVIKTNPKNKKDLLSKAKEKLVGVTKAENILKFNGTPQANLEETIRDVTDLGVRFNAVKNKALNSVNESNPQNSMPVVAEAVNKYSDSLKGFVNKKSLIGMATVIGIAVSIQTINRAITRKQFGAEGAPIYKDFGKKDTTQKMDENQKKKFFGKKLLSAAGMYGLAAASMMKKPSMKMFQFSGIFPTMDQCRWIAASTFASRMMGAEDENELRETTVRDIASFSGLYFLGDYVKKGAASGIEAFSKTNAGAKLLGEDIVLLNRSKEAVKPVVTAGDSIVKKAGGQAVYRAKQFGNWIKNTELKTAAEVSSVKVRNLRNICRVADIAFSVAMLGILLPKYNRAVTEKKVAAAKKQEEANRYAVEHLNEKTPNIFKNMI